MSISIFFITAIIFSIEPNCNTFMIDFILQSNWLHVFHNIEVSNSCILLNKYIDSINVIYVKYIYNIRYIVVI